jgi:hypothetical protein
MDDFFRGAGWVPMSEQLTLDAYRNSDPETSRLAAADAAMHARTLRGHVVRLLRELGPMTDFQIADALAAQGIPCAGQTSAGKRRLEAQRLGDVVPLVVDGEVVKRPAPSGSLAIVWKAVGP